MNAEKTAEFEIAHVLMVDVVEYSKMLIDDQREINAKLTAIVRATKAFQAADAAGKLIRLPTGDGMALIFFTRLDDPVRCAMEIAHSLREHAHIRLRMGIHSGPVSGVMDVNGRSNVAGVGINIAQRVMDAGDGGHILLSSRVAEDLMQYREWQVLLHDLGECEAKHGVRLHLYNLYSHEIGNPIPPRKCQLPRPANEKSAAAPSPKREHWIVAAMSLAATVVVLAAYALPNVALLSSFPRAEIAYEDFLERIGRKTATRADFVFLGIDDVSMNVANWPAELRRKTETERPFQLMAQPFPWPREIWALLLDCLVASGARLVAFDIVFSTPMNDNESFRAALDRYRDNVVIGWNPNYEAEGTVTKIGPTASFIPPPPFQDDRVGYVSFFPDPIDGQIRAAQYTMTNLQMARQNSPGFGKPYESLAARALDKLGHQQDVPRDLKPHQIRFCARGAYQPLPLWEVFDDERWHSKYGDGTFFEDKLVLVGASSGVVSDVVATPIDRQTAGGAIQLSAIAAALDHEFLLHVPHWLACSAFVCGGAAAWLAGVWIHRLRTLSGVIVLIAATSFGAGLLVYNVWGLFLPVVFLNGTLLLATLLSVTVNNAAPAVALCLQHITASPPTIR